MKRQYPYPTYEASKSMIFGWVTPSREFIECGMFKHYQVIPKNHELRLASEWDSKQDYLREVEADCQAAIDDGEHPEWHNYEMAVSEVEYTAIQNLYNAGYIRVGQHKRCLHFEGRGTTLAERKTHLEDLAEGYGLSTEFERVGN